MVYVPGDTDGTLNVTVVGDKSLLLVLPVTTSVLPKRMIRLLFGVNPYKTPNTNVPTGPWVEVNDKA